MHAERTNKEDTGHDILPIGRNIQNVKRTADDSEKQSAGERAEKFRRAGSDGRDDAAVTGDAADDVTGRCIVGAQPAEQIATAARTTSFRFILALVPRKVVEMLRDDRDGEQKRGNARALDITSARRYKQT